MCIRLLIAIALVLACTTALYAQESPASVALIVNGAPTGDALVLIGDGPLLLDVATVERLELDVPDGAAIHSYGSLNFVALAALEPRVRYSFDARHLTLALTVASQGLQRVDVGGAAAPVPNTARPSAFLNYDVVQSSQFGTRGFLEADAGRGSTRFYANATYDGSLLVNNAYAERDDVAPRVQSLLGSFTTVGDALVNPDSLTGLVVQRSFALDPLRPAYPLPAVSGIAAGPSVADVYVNGSLVRSVPLAPGPFVLQGIPTAAAPGRVSVVVHDPNGGAQQIERNFITAASLLGKGTTDFSYAVGLDRLTRRPAADAFYRLGLTSDLTLGARVLSGAGGSVAEATGDVALAPAILHIGYARSGASQGFETALQVAYRGGGFSANLLQRPAARSSLAQIATADRLVTASISQSVSRSVSLSASLQRNTFELGPSQLVETVGAQTHLGSTLVASAFVERDRSGAGAHSNLFAIMLSMPLGGTRSATANVTSNGSSVGVQRTIDGSVGSGYAIQLGDAFSQASYQVRTEEGGVQATLDRSAGATSSFLEVDGAVAAVGTHVGLTQKIDDAFALVEVPGVAGAPVFVDHQLAGYTGGRGTLLVTGLHAFVPTHISIAYDRLPLDVELKDDEIEVTPGARGGALALFPVTRLHLVEGTVLLSNGSPAPAYASVVVVDGSRELTSRLDERGRFSFNGLTPGRYRLRLVTDHPNDCNAELEVPRETGFITSVGEIRCKRITARR